MPRKNGRNIQSGLTKATAAASTVSSVHQARKALGGSVSNLDVIRRPGASGYQLGLASQQSQYPRRLVTEDSASQFKSVQITYGSKKTMVVAKRLEHESVQRLASAMGTRPRGLAAEPGGRSPVFNSRYQTAGKGRSRNGGEPRLQNFMSASAQIAGHQQTMKQNQQTKLKAAANSLAGRAETELDSYDLLAKYGAAATTTGDRQSMLVRNHLQQLRDTNVDKFSKTYQKMMKTTCKGTAGKLMAEINALKKEPEIKGKGGSINIHQGHRSLHHHGVAEDENAGGGAAPAKKHHHHYHHQNRPALKRSDYDKAIMSRSLVGPIEALI